ncbi:MAG TPA: D-sedoheptulose 7-phosphate isomerase [Acetobacteraceae bacterium]
MRKTDADYVTAYLARSVAAATALADDALVRTALADMARVTIAAMQAGGKLMIAGNGGSASDAQHIAGEIVGRLMYDRIPLPAIALTADAAVMTATANDYGFEHVFARQVSALGRPGDVLLAISTSGRSANLLRALEAARDKGMRCLGFAGRAGGPMAALCDHVLRAPADETAIVQQLHITAAHVLCALVERALCPPP